MNSYSLNIRNNFKLYNLNKGEEIKKILSTQGIDSAWWSRFLNSKISLSFYRFLELCFLFDLLPELLILSSVEFQKIITTHKLPYYSSKIPLENKIKKCILESKKILQNAFNNGNHRKNTFFINYSNIETIPSTKTLKRIFDYEYYIHFKFKTLFLILDVLEIDLSDFLKKLEEELHVDY
ncbi:MAG: hypothetical protein ACRC0S_09290 [Fusobacteriaceae bacterium]